MCSLLDDEREILSIWYEPDGQYQVGKNGVTKIKVYKETGEFCYVPWFAVWRNEVLEQKLNAKFIAGVMYREEPPHEA